MTPTTTVRRLPASISGSVHVALLPTGVVDTALSRLVQKKQSLLRRTWVVSHPLTRERAKPEGPAVSLAATAACSGGRAGLGGCGAAEWGVADRGARGERAVLVWRGRIGERAWLGPGSGDALHMGRLFLRRRRPLPWCSRVRLCRHPLLGPAPYESQWRGGVEPFGADSFGL